MVYHEIAIDPGAVKTIEDFGLLKRMFGFEHGRLIAYMPAKPKKSDWPILLYENLKSRYPEMAKRFEIEIATLVKERGWRSRSGSTLESDKNWRDLARSEHTSRHFDSILCAESKVCEDPEYSFADLHMPPDDYPKFLREAIHTAELEKDPTKFLVGLRPLICTATRLSLIDAYFDPRPTEEDREKGRDNIWLRSFKKLAHELREQSRTRIDIHLHTKTPKDCDPEDFVNQSVSELLGWIPNDTTLKFSTWSEKDRGQRFHARYLLTDKGGAGLEYGSDMRMNQRTDIYLLSPGLRDQRLAEFDPESQVPSPYELDYSLTSLGTRNS